MTMEVSLRRDPFTIDLSITARQESTVCVSHLEIPNITNGKIELKDFYKFIVDLEFALNMTIEKAERTNYDHQS